MKAKIQLIALMVVYFLLANRVPVRAMWQPSMAVLLFVIAQRVFIKPSLLWSVGYALMLGLSPMLISFAVLASNTNFSALDAFASAISFAERPFLLSVFLLIPIFLAVVAWFITVKTFWNIPSAES